MCYKAATSTKAGGPNYNNGTSACSDGECLGFCQDGTTYYSCETASFATDIINNPSLYGNGSYACNTSNCNNYAPTCSTKAFPGNSLIQPMIRK